MTVKNVSSNCVRPWLLIGAALFASLTSARAEQRTFETASVLVNKEPGKPGTVGTTMRVQPTGITFLEVSLANCIAAAYGVTSYQVQGPNWIRTDWFDIVAKTAQPTSRQEQMLMLRALLADRFGLKLRKEQKPMRGFALVVDGRDGPRLTAAADATGEKTVGRGVYPFGMSRTEKGWAFTSASMADFAEYLSNAGPIGVPVVDQTKLIGRFDFVFALMPLRERTVTDGGPTDYIDALAELGLKLQPRRVPMDAFIVDSASRTPTPN